MDFGIKGKRSRDLPAPPHPDSSLTHIPKSSPRPLPLNSKGPITGWGAKGGNRTRSKQGEGVRWRQGRGLVMR